MSTQALSRLIPPELAGFLRRRLADLAGLAASLVGLTLAVALASHDPADPSLNTATGAPVANLAGRTGAVFADAALQGVGLAAWLLVAAPLGWAFALVARGAVSAPLVRLACLLAGLPVLAAALALVPVGATQSLPAGPGGVAGPLLIDWVLGLGSAVLGPLGRVFAALFTLGLAVLLAFVAIGLSPGEWQRAIGAAARRVAGGGRRDHGLPAPPRASA
ncbi:cell division protein FtsK, partial [Elioraea sp. Yellowstone]|uniref:DNA translocase FtsK 4TM domain-containing protein n=1 Tax=Elioraea sp. Yellowstone TaxID=2592070 RepID=UPI0011712BC7